MGTSTKRTNAAAAAPSRTKRARTLPLCDIVVDAAAIAHAAPAPLLEPLDAPTHTLTATHDICTSTKSTSVVAAPSRTKRVRLVSPPPTPCNVDVDAPIAGVAPAPLLEPLEQHKMPMLRAEVRRLQLKVTWKGPASNDHKQGLITLLREHWRCEERARAQIDAHVVQPHAATRNVTTDGNDDKSEGNTNGKSQGKNKTRRKPVSARTYSSAAEAQRQEPEHTLPRIHQAQSDSTNMDVESLQRAYWKSQCELACQELSTAQLKFTIQLAKLRDEQVSSVTRKVETLRRELKSVDANSLIAAEITDELCFYASEKRRLLRVFADHA